MFHAPRTAHHGLLALLLALGLCACSRALPPANLVICNGAEPGSLNPATSTGLEELRIVMAMFEGLMRVNPMDASAMPGLAERYETSPDGKTYTFLIRTNAQWSTGERITAQDFVYSWRRVLDPATASEYAGQLFYIKNAEAYYNRQIQDPKEVGIEALDDLTLQVELNHPTPFFLGLCAFQTLAVVPQQAIERHQDRWLRTPPVPVSGPYQLDFWRLGDRVRLRANPRYWDAAKTGCQVVDLLPIRGASTAFNLYQRDAVDIIWDKELIPSELYPYLRTNEAHRVNFNSFTYLGTYFLRFNTTRPPLDDARVRRALAMTINKPLLVDKILKTGETIAAQFVPLGTANSLPVEGLPYDPEGARALLKEVERETGRLRPIEYLFESVSGSGASPHAKIAVELQQMWQRELGLRVELRQMEKQVYLKNQRSLEYDVTRSTWIGDYNDPNTFLDLFRSNNGNNRTGWKDARYDAWMEEAAVQTNLTRRAEILRQAESRLLREGAPIVPVYYFSGFNYYNPARIQGVWGNILDSHPINAIRKTKAPARGLVSAEHSGQPRMNTNEHQ